LAARRRQSALTRIPLSRCFGRAFAGSAEFAKTQVAVAANSIEPAREIAARFREKTGHEAFRVASSPRSP
jgi:hypothetical protein